MIQSTATGTQQLDSSYYVVISSEAAQLKFTHITKCDIHRSQWDHSTRSPSGTISKSPNSNSTISDLRSPIYDLRSTISKSPISDLRSINFRSPNLRSTISKSPISDLRSPNLRTPNLQSAISKSPIYDLQISDIRSPNLRYPNLWSRSPFTKSPLYVSAVAPSCRQSPFIKNHSEWLCYPATTLLPISIN